MTQDAISEPLTAPPGRCECCRRLLVTPGPKGRRFCSSQCRLLAWAIRRASQAALPFQPPAVRVPVFDGATLELGDRPRLARQLEAVRRLMLDGQWRTLRGISVEVNAPEASVSARLRDLRKERFGGWTVERRRLGRGLFQYRMMGEKW